jgi:uncharacterized protein (DUF983 family)
MKKGSKLYSILHNKCPKCQEGHFFSSNNPYRLPDFSRMEKSCTVCGQSFEPEPGFNYGSMYVSYGLNVLVFLLVWIGAELFIPRELSMEAYFFIVGIPLLVLVPVTFRLSRLIWINFFVHYRASERRGKVSPEEKKGQEE